MVTKYENTENAIRQGDVPVILKNFFPGNEPVIRRGLRTENELWDYKSDCPRINRASANPWAHIAKDVLAFHNCRGGIIFFGIDDRSFEFCGASTQIDSKIFNDKIRKYIGDRFWVEYVREFIQDDQRYLGIAVIPPRGQSLAPFIKDAPIINGSQAFKANQYALRKGDSSVIIKKSDSIFDEINSYAVHVNKKHYIDEPSYRILNPEYQNFVNREKACKAVTDALADVRTSITSITGIGGMGKTALATWATIWAFERKMFSFIISITAKDRELTNHGISSLKPDIGSFDLLLNEVLDVIGFPEESSKSTAAKEKVVRELLTDTNTLLFVDNLETVDDKRIISFLDDLPIGVRAITTSRRSIVRVAMRPVDLGPMEPSEVKVFIKNLSERRGLSYLSKIKDEETVKIGKACDGIPLVIQWTIRRADSVAEVLKVSDTITTNKKKENNYWNLHFVASLIQ